MDDMPALVDVIEEDEASGSVSTFVYAPPSYAASATVPASVADDRGEHANGQLDVAGGAAQQAAGRARVEQRVGSRRAVPPERFSRGVFPPRTLRTLASWATPSTRRSFGRPRRRPLLAHHTPRSKQRVQGRKAYRRKMSTLNRIFCPQMSSFGKFESITNNVFSAFVRRTPKCSIF